MPEVEPAAGEGQWVIKIGLTIRYSRTSSLLGGIIILVIGALLLFAPQMLRF